MSQDTRYFPTASNVSVFLNTLHVDLAYRIDWKEVTDKIPIYGYNDTYYSTVAQARSVIQGFLITNFVRPGYLSAAIRYKRDSSKYEDQYQWNLNHPTLYGYSSLDPRSLALSLKTELPPNIPGDDRKARAEYIASLLKSNTDRKAVKEELKKITTLPNYAEVDARERLEDTSLVLANQPEKGSTIDVYYTDPVDSAQFVRFENVYFTDVSQQISQAGAEGSSEPLYEIYQFIASKKITKTKYRTKNNLR